RLLTTANGFDYEKLYQGLPPTTRTVAPSAGPKGTSLVVSPHHAWTKISGALYCRQPGWMLPRVRTLRTMKLSAVHVSRNCLNTSRVMSTLLYTAQVRSLY
ncbi:unnamed protein product, partial [Ectocarpus sp. 12 AP-2014]